ncbi:MAG: toll/interleukin-1 receptor domain-containing protein [Chloroflexi bacterium]|nr:toll/interleukin-1 receptor domain-containing protein [Chloroflexota bacterium]
MSIRKYDVFLSYSSSDREAVIAPFLSKIEQLGIRSWCDIRQISWGDSIVENIQKGINESIFLIAFISSSFLMKSWPLKELRTAHATQLSGKITVLPVLLGISPYELSNELPFLSDINNLWVKDYDPSKQIPDWYITNIAQELKL